MSISQIGTRPHVLEMQQSFGTRDERMQRLLEEAGQYCCITMVQKILRYQGTLEDGEELLATCKDLVERAGKIGTLEEMEIRLHLGVHHNIVIARAALAEYEQAEKK